MINRGNNDHKSLVRLKKNILAICLSLTVPVSAIDPAVISHAAVTAGSISKNAAASAKPASGTAASGTAVTGTSASGQATLAVSSSSVKLKLGKTEVSMRAGKLKTVKVRTTYAKVTIKSSNLKVLAVALTGNVIRLISLKKGKAKVEVKGYNKKGKLKETAYINVKVKKKKEVDLAAEYAPDSIHAGEGTYYDKGDSPGSSGLDDFEKEYYTVAMNTEDYINGLQGAYIEITDKDGDTVCALVTDLLPAGAKGDVDLTKVTFEKIEELGTGRMDITWRVIPLPTMDAVRFLWKKGSSKYWSQIQVRNNVYPVKSVEYYDSETDKYIAFEKEVYNYYTAPKGMGEGPFTLRLTDIYGQQIIEEGVVMNSDGEEVVGRHNFPVLEQ
ncbi:MAG: hypothetical protein J6P16_06815 [Eubacterium sp.]|nr:hypothetical protein [Eubacterium sp.]